MEIFITIVVAIIAIAMWSGYKKQRAIDEANGAYRASLAELVKRPADAGLRQNTLTLGRIYSNLVRDKKGVTMFDEVALMNDINAACAGAAQPQYNPRASDTPVEERLLKLKALREAGHLEEQEYVERRKAILSEV